MENLNIEHAKKSARRFHVSTQLLGSYVMETDPTIVSQKDTSLPLIIRRHKDGRIYCLSNPICPQNYKYSFPSSDFITPYVVNGAFSLELHLKLLAFFETGQWIKNEHKLNKIFEKLSPQLRSNIQSIILETLNKSKLLQQNLLLLKKEEVFIDWEIESLLTHSSEAFIKWRYAFESHPGSFCGYSEIQKALVLCIRNFDTIVE